MKEYYQVSSKTIKHHLKSPWMWKEKAQGYYFCSDPDCDVVYFGQDKSELRTQVGLKEPSENGLVCYCYGVTKKDAVNAPHIRQFVVQETKNKGCACESKNPSGKCCLASFPKQ